MNVTMVLWSDFARQGKTYMERIKNGETFLIFHASEPVAIVRPLEPNENVHLTIESGDATT